jgi:sRNA-binding carbon storage regulator CsrA
MGAELSATETSQEYTDEFCCNLDEKFVLAIATDKVTVRIHSVQVDRAELRFDAPRRIVILRAELFTGERKDRVDSKDVTKSGR